MYLSLSLYTYIYIYIYIYLYLSIYLSLSLSIYIYIYTNIMYYQSTFQIVSWLDLLHVLPRPVEAMLGASPLSLFLLFHYSY